jgi:transcriptional antiterminator
MANAPAPCVRETDWVTSPEAADLIGVSERALRYITDKHPELLPKHKNALTRAVRYKRADCLATKAARETWTQDAGAPDA